MPVYEGDLTAKIKDFRAQGFQASAKVIESMAHQILLALQYVHSQNPPIIHRDVKPLNILWRANRFLLTDFGCAKATDSNRTMLGTRLYMSPELWEGGVQTTEIDIFAFGVTLLECCKELPQFQHRRSK